jgi:GT2 family glycosyltransferase
VQLDRTGEADEESTFVPYEPSVVRQPRLSVIIPTYNRPDYLRATVDQLVHQDFADFELLIIDQSPDRAPTQCSDPRVHHHYVPLIGPLAGINQGVARARGEIILILNDDVRLGGRDFLDAHLDCYRDPKVGGVGGRVVDRVLRPNTRRTQCKIDWAGRTVENLTGNVGCSLQSVGGTNMSFRAEVFRRIGEFDTGYTGTALLGETDFATRARAAGWTLMFAPRACLVHLSAPRGGVRTDPLATECSRFRNTAYYVVKHRGIVGLLPFVPAFSAIAVKRAWLWRRPESVPRLLRAMRDGVRAGQGLRKAPLALATQG